MALLKKTLMERFREKVNERGPDECWPWTAAYFKSGYGAFRVGNKQMKAHRVAFYLVTGNWPVGMACHRCDTPSCCNPAHLFDGSATDNARDRDAKGRGANRERSPHCKLAEPMRDQIRREYQRGSREFGVIGLAEKYRVGRSTISRIVRGKWR